MAHAIAAGEVGMALLCGAEAISTARRLAFLKENPDWSEEVGGQLEDRGYGEALLTSEFVRHGALTPMVVYALFENARRARLGLSRADYAMEMGRLFAPFTKVASGNLHAASREVHDAEHLITLAATNRMTCDPYPQRLVARDQVNQGAAVLMTSVDRARALGVPEARFIYLHGGADLRERTVAERADLSSSPAAALAVRSALEAAGVALDAIDLFDFYSCFPIAVFNVRDALGLSPDDPRPLTVTGGLPYFGGRETTIPCTPSPPWCGCCASDRARGGWSGPTADICRNIPWASIRPRRRRGVDSIAPRLRPRSTLARVRRRAGRRLWQGANLYHRPLRKTAQGRGDRAPQGRGRAIHRHDRSEKSQGGPRHDRPGSAGRPGEAGAGRAGPFDHPFVQIEDGFEIMIRGSGLWR